jgi:hypothetical protein
MGPLASEIMVFAKSKFDNNSTKVDEGQIYALLVSQRL